jgi:hypothetical protein
MRIPAKRRVFLYAERSMFDVSIGCGEVHREAMIVFDKVKLGPHSTAITGPAVVEHNRTCPALEYFH